MSGNNMPVARSLSVDELIAYYDKIIEEVDEDLFNEGVATVLPRPEVPKGLVGILEFDASGDPVCPSDVTELPELELRQAYSFFNGQTNYVASLLNKGKVNKLKADRVMTVITSALKAYYREEEKVPANAVVDKLNLDKRYLVEDRDVMKIKIRIASLDFRHDTLKRNCNHLSREMKTRQEEFQRTQKDHNDGYTPDGKKGGSRKPKFRRHG
jgi:hypothetical protein